MLDAFIKPHIENPLQATASLLSKSGLGQIPLLLIGFGIALGGCFAIGMASYIPGLILILLGRFVAAIVFSMTEQTQVSSAFARYLTIFLEWIVYAAFILFFALSLNNYFAACIMLFGYTGFCASLIALYNIPQTEELPLLHPARLIEETEILIFMGLCCLFPAAFSFFALLFGIALWVSVAGRIFQAKKLLA